MKDLTVGKPGRVLLAYSLPLFGSIIFQQLYNIADSFVAGHFISTEALAAVGNSSEITLIFIAIAFGCNIGTSVVTANLFGQKEMKQVHTCVTTALIFCGILGVLLSAVGILTSEWMLTLLDTPVETMKDSVAYIQIYLMSYVFLMLYQVATGIFPPWGIPKRRSTSSPCPRLRIFLWISSSSVTSTWACPAWHGRRSCASPSAALSP